MDFTISESPYNQLTGQGRYGMHHREKSIEGEQKEGVDRGVGGDVGEILHRLAPNASKGPRRKDVVGGGEGNAEDYKE